MTNAMIVMTEQIRLQQEGILKFTGRMLQTPEGIEFPEIQPIHTYQVWKNMGYQVKKGSKAVAQFPIWKYVQNKKQAVETEEEAQAAGHCFMKMASWFTDEQVEPITEGQLN